MNVRMQSPPAPRLPAAAPAIPLAQGFAAPLGPAAAALFFDEPAGPPRARLTARAAGAPLPGPSLSTRLELAGGGRRRLMLVAQGAPWLLRRAVTLELDGRPAAAVDPDWLQPPLVEPAALLDGLAREGRRRLLRLALTTGAALCGSDAAPELARLARRLLELLGAAPLPAAAWRPIGAAGGIVSYRAPANLDPSACGALVLLADAAMRLGGAELRAETAGDARLLHLYCPRPLPPGAVVVGLGPAGLQLRAPEAGAAARPLGPWLARRDPPTRAWALGLVEAAAADPAAAALAHELRHAASPPPRLRLRHLAGDRAGLLLAAALDDPHDLVRALLVERGGPENACEATLEPGPGRLIRLPLPRRSAIEDRCRLRLVLRSGRLRTVHEGAVPATATPPGVAPPDDAAAVAALDRARCAMDRPRRRVRAEAFGPAPGAVRLSLVAAGGEDLDAVRALAAMTAAEPGARGVQLLLHAVDDAGAPAIRAVLANAAAVFALPCRLVTLAPGADATDRLLAALALARGPATLVLGAATLPAAPGWLAPWRRLGPRRPALGGVLLDHDGAVLDAGGEARGPCPDRRWRGLSAAALPRTAAAATALLNAGCVGLARPAVDRLLAAPERHPNPDVMLAALAAALRAEGARPATLLAARFVRYAAVPADPLEAAADAAALARAVKGFFSLGGEEGACAR